MRAEFGGRLSARDHQSSIQVTFCRAKKSQKFPSWLRRHLSSVRDSFAIHGFKTTSLLPLSVYLICVYLLYIIFL